MSEIRTVRSGRDFYRAVPVDPGALARGKFSGLTMGELVWSMDEETYAREQQALEVLREVEREIQERGRA